MRLSSLLKEISTIVDDLSGINLVKYKLNKEITHFVHERTGAALPKPYKITSSWQLMWMFLSKTVRHKFHECGRRNQNMGVRGGHLQLTWVDQILDHADIDAIGRSVRSPVLNQWTPSVMSHTTATVTDDLVQVLQEIPRKLSTVLSGADILGSACRGQPCC